MYLRFISTDIDPDSRTSAGIFTAAYELRYSGVLSAYELDRLCDLLVWFGRRLPEPTMFMRTRRAAHRRPGICWFKISAREHLERIWEMVALLEDNGVWIRMLKTAQPGYIVYEDDWQIVAEPFRHLRH